MFCPAYDVAIAWKSFERENSPGIGVLGADETATSWQRGGWQASRHHSQREEHSKKPSASSGWNKDWCLSCLSDWFVWVLAVQCSAVRCSAVTAIGTTDRCPADDTRLQVLCPLKTLYISVRHRHWLGVAVVKTWVDDRTRATWWRLFDIHVRRCVDCYVTLRVVGALVIYGKPNFIMNRNYWSLVAHLVAHILIIPLPRVIDYCVALFVFRRSYAGYRRQVSWH